MDLNKAKMIAEDLKSYYKLENWKFEWTNMKCCLGLCMYGKKTIRMSSQFVLLNEQNDVIDTIIHELAHCLTSGHGHDRVWSMQAMSMGDDGKRTAAPHIKMPTKGKYTLRCGCGEWQRNARSQSIIGNCCAKCHKSFKYIRNNKEVV